MVFIVQGALNRFPHCPGRNFCYLKIGGNLIRFNSPHPTPLTRKKAGKLSMCTCVYISVHIHAVTHISTPGFTFACIYGHLYTLVYIKNLSN